MSTGLGKKNTWLDWHLVPTDRPSIAPPEVITKTVEVPGMGDLDLTESLTGYPAYKNRTGSITFMVMNDYENWHDIYQKMCSYLHGRKLYMSYEEDPGYFYCGRFTVDAYDSGDNNSEITINYELEPFKYDYNKGYVEGGYWDTFDFDQDNREGVNYRDIFYAINVDSDEYVTLLNNAEWGNFTEMPIIPTFKVENLQLGGFITIHYVNSEMGIDVEKTLTSSGDHRIPEIIFTQIRNHGKVRFGMIRLDSESKNPLPVEYSNMYPMGTETFKLEVKGHGTLTIDYNAGRK